MVFRKDVNGLRAWAVTLVVLYHFGVPFVSGGFLGVDIFFVISGFLMVGILMRSLESSNLRQLPGKLVEFYLARARRILPALMVLCASLLAVGWFYLSPTKYKAVAIQVLSALGFSSNGLFLNQSGYFDTAAQQKMLLHTWSLSVEWQFYMLLPLVMGAVWVFKKGRAYQGLALLALSVLSFGYCLSLVGDSQSKAFYSTFSRSWEMLVGGGVYLLSAKRQSGMKWLGAIGFLAILGSAFFFSSALLWPGGWAVIPVIATALILYANNNSAWTSFGIFQYLGARSYSIYLWHWPIVVSMGFMDIELTAPSIVIGIGLSLILAEVSYRVVERRSKSIFLNYKYRPAFVVSLALLVSLVAVGISIRHDKGYPSRLPPVAIKLAKYKFSYAEYRFGQCFLSEEQGYQTFKDCVSEGGGVESPTVLLWGDSHAAHLYPGLVKSIPANERFAQFTASGCPPFMGVDIEDRRYCRDINSYVADWIVKNKPAEVVLSARWSRYDWKLLSKTLEFLHSNGVRRVTVFGPAPVWNGRLSDIMLEELFIDGGAIPERQASYLVSDGGVEAGIKEIAESYGTKFVSVRNILCNDHGCLTHLRTQDGPVPMAWDEAHLTSQASEYLIGNSQMFK